MKITSNYNFLTSIILSCLFLVQLSLHGQHNNQTSNTNNLAQNSMTSDTESKIEAIIKTLTLEEKVAMCHAQSKFLRKLLKIYQLCLTTLLPHSLL